MWKVEIKTDRVGPRAKLSWANILGPRIVQVEKGMKMEPSLIKEGRKIEILKKSIQIFSI